MTWIWILMFAAIVGNGFRLRARARGFGRISPAEAVPTGSAPEAGAACETEGSECEGSECEDSESDDYAWLLAKGVELAAPEREAAIAFARARGLDVLELVPRDLSVDRSLLLLRTIDPVTYARDPLVPGRGAGHATLVKQSVLDRARLTASEGIEPKQFSDNTTTLKAYAPRSSDVAVSGGLRALASSSPDALAYWCAVYGESTGIVVGFQVLQYLLFAVGLFVAPLFAGLALVAYQFQPWVIFSGSPIEPADLARQPLDRIFRAIGSSWRMWAAKRSLARKESPARKAEREREAESRREYEQRMAAGPAGFFEPRREDCPLCGASDLELRLEAPDLFHHKPGSFRLDRCVTCGHVFQNPRLSFDGLDFYYKDFYAGAFDAPMEIAFQSGAEGYRARAEALRGHAVPHRWLDVGTGHGHFCLLAKETWPETRFDGLDMGESVEEAKRRGWVTEGYRQIFPDVAPKLAGAYDVVSMHHYLEHTLDPMAEISAAARVLEPGGHLLIEVPDPDYPYARIFGQRWISWFQPQHLHFVSLENLERILRERGFEPVAAETGAAHIPVDMSFWLYSMLETLAPPLGLPWQPPQTPGRYAWRIVVFSTLGPLLGVTLVLDKLLGSFLRKSGKHGNTYRLLARRVESPAAAESSEPAPA